MKQTTYSTIFAETIKETEKAYQFKCTVRWSWDDKKKTFWFPKSVVAWKNEGLAEVADWFLVKLEQENSFKGHDMRFVDPYAMQAEA